MVVDRAGVSTFVVAVDDVNVGVLAVLVDRVGVSTFVVEVDGLDVDVFVVR